MFVRTYCRASSRNIIVYGECTRLWSLLSKLPNVGWQEVSERCERKRMNSNLRLAATDMKALGGNSFVTSAKRWKSAVGFAPRPLHPRRKDLRYSMNKRLGWAPEGSGLLQQRQVSLTCLKSNRESFSSQPSPHTGYARTVLCCRQ
jgi:hypothetical protein